MKRLFLIAVAGLTLSGMACENTTVQSPVPPAESTVPTYRQIHNDFEIVGIPWFERDRMRPDVDSSEMYIEPLDADSVEMCDYRGTIFYQPVNLSHRINTFIATYRYTDDTKYLDRAEKYAQCLMDHAHIIDNAAYLPYDVDYCVHGLSEVFLPKSWYSGMAQGEFLMVLCRLYEITGKDSYIDFARSIFRSLTRLRSVDNNVWVSRLDDYGYLWIEEYPHAEHPGMTLNGYIQALFGVYEYIQITNSRQGKRLWDACLSTLKHYLPEYRREGGYSYYCLGHKAITGDGYHSMHIGQLGLLAKLTGDSFFSDMADQFESDMPAISDGSEYYDMITDDNLDLIGSTEETGQR